MAYRKRTGHMIMPRFGAIDRLDPINNKLIGFWPANVAGKFNDISSNYNPIDLTNYLNSTSVGISPWGRAEKFDGSTQYGQGEKNVQAVTGIEGFSASVWVNPTSFSNYQSPFNQWDEGSTLRCWGLIIFGDGTLHGYNSSNGTDFANTASTATLTLNRWQMITMTYKSNTVSIYLNGVQIGTGTGAGSGMRQNAQLLYIGKSPAFGGSGNAWFQGQAALFKMWRRCLSQEEIRRIYSNPLAGLIRPTRTLRTQPGTTALSNFFFSG